jgi:capsular exopolysaccharide synthesis family protein
MPQYEPIEGEHFSRKEKNQRELSRKKESTRKRKHRKNSKKGEFTSIKRNQKKRAVQLIAHTHPHSPITEQYRLVRNNIQFSSVDRDIKTILITSPESADGKSMTAANLAIVLAQQEKRVVLVDVDLRKPSVHYTFNVSNMAGITNVLSRKVSLSLATYKTSIPNLDILTSGPIPPNPSELLNSNAMGMVIEELKQMYDYVVFDSPPILSVTDSQSIANKCDGVILVISSGKTYREKAGKAKELLEKARSPILGVVVNRSKSKAAEYYG